MVYILLVVFLAFCIIYLKYIGLTALLGLSARPILSVIGTYNCKVAKFLVPLLHPFTTGSFTVKDSFSFVLEITLFRTSSKFVMASFVVSSLFANISL